MESSPPTSKRIAAGEIVDETFSVYGRYFAPLIGASLAVFVVVGLISGLLRTTDDVLPLLLAAIVQLVGYALYTGFVVRLVQDVRDGRLDQGLGDLFSAAAPAIPGLIAFGILWGIGVGIGFVLLIVPGLILLTFWSVGSPAIVIEGAGPLQAFGRSWRLVRGDAWSVFGALLAILLIVIGIGFVLGIIATPIGDGATVLAAIISNVLTAPIFAIAVSAIYFNLVGAESTAAPPEPPEPPAATP